MGGIGDVVEEYLLARAGERVGDHELAIIGQSQRGRLVEIGKLHDRAVAGD
jgi:hypothetical protein